MHRALPLLLAWVAAVVLAGTASAVPVTYVVTTDVTFDGLGVIVPGNPVVLTFNFEPTTPDEDPALGSYVSTAPGAVGTNVLFAEIVGLSLVASPGSPGDWTASGTSDIFLVGAITWTLDLSGLGLTPDQILPDFDSLSGGELLVANDLGLILSADVTSVATIPEPGMATLVGLGLIALGIRRHRR